MTRTGEVLRLYGLFVEPRPFSRFSRDEIEQAENSEWRKQAMAWGDIHVDEHGVWDGCA